MDNSLLPKGATRNALLASQPEMRAYEPGVLGYIRQAMNSVSSYYPDLYERTGQTLGLLGTATLPMAAASGFGVPDAVAAARGLLPVAARGTPAFDAATARVMERRFPDERSFTGGRNTYNSATDQYDWYHNRPMTPNADEYWNSSTGLSQRAGTRSAKEAPRGVIGTIHGPDMPPVNDKDAVSAHAQRYMNELLAQMQRGSFRVVP